MALRQATRFSYVPAPCINKECDRSYLPNTGGSYGLCVRCNQAKRTWGERCCSRCPAQVIINYARGSHHKQQIVLCAVCAGERASQWAVAHDGCVSCTSRKNRHDSDGLCGRCAAARRKYGQRICRCGRPTYRNYSVEPKVVCLDCFWADMTRVFVNRDRLSARQLAQQTAFSADTVLNFIYHFQGKKPLRHNARELIDDYVNLLRDNHWLEEPTTARDLRWIYLRERFLAEDHPRLLELLWNRFLAKLFRRYYLRSQSKADFRAILDHLARQAIVKWDRKRGAPLPIFVYYETRNQLMSLIRAEYRSKPREARIVVSLDQPAFVGGDTDVTLHEYTGLIGATSDQESRVLELDVAAALGEFTKLLSQLELTVLTDRLNNPGKSLRETAAKLGRDWKQIDNARSKIRKKARQFNWAAYGLDVAAYFTGLKNAASRKPYGPPRA